MRRPKSERYKWDESAGRMEQQRGGADVGSIVHYIAEDDHRHRCVAAIVTNVYGGDGVSVALVAFGYYTGQQSYHDHVLQNDPTNQPGGWHWPGHEFCNPAGEPGTPVSA